MGIEVKEKLVECHIWSTTLYSAQTWTLSKVDQKYLKSFEVMVVEKISWIDCVRNELLHRVNEDRNILCIVKRRKANSIGHISCRNCLLQQGIERKIKGRTEVMGQQGRRHK
jgi:hypothetical protein